jgi:HNH endonuclease
MTITLGEGAAAPAGGKGAGTAAIGSAENAALKNAAKEGAAAEGSAALGPRRPTALQRDRVFEKSKDSSGTPRCDYCGNELTRNYGKPNSYEADHRQPYSRGGPTTEENLAPACRTCNRSKGAKTPEEFKLP